MTETANWNRLAENLKLRRNLEAALFPSTKIGKVSTGYRYLSEAQNKARLNEIRAEHRQWARELKEQHGLKTAGEVRDKIKQLKVEEQTLWETLRPDLYPSAPIKIQSL